MYYYFSLKIILLKLSYLYKNLTSFQIDFLDFQKYFNIYLIKEKYLEMKSSFSIETLIKPIINKTSRKITDNPKNHETPYLRTVSPSNCFTRGDRWTSLTFARVSINFAKTREAIFLRFLANFGIKRFQERFNKNQVDLGSSPDPISLCIRGSFTGLGPVTRPEFDCSIPFPYITRGTSRYVCT